MKIVISIPKRSLIFDVGEDNVNCIIDSLDVKKTKELAVNFCLSLVEHFSVNGVFSLDNLDEEAGEFSLTFKEGKIRLHWLSYSPLYGTIEVINPTEEFKEWCIESLKHFGAQYSKLYEVTEDSLV